MKHLISFAALLSLLAMSFISNCSDVLSQTTKAAERGPFKDAVMEVQVPRQVPVTRPEQEMTAHDQSGVFDASSAQPSSTAFEQQPDQGKVLGFDFYRDPLNASRPMMTFEEIMRKDIAEKPKVMERFEAGTIYQRTWRRTDQDLYPAGDQRESALHARWSLPDTGRYGGVF
jgi:hypothetical protein